MKVLLKISNLISQKRDYYPFKKISFLSLFITIIVIFSSSERNFLHSRSIGLHNQHIIFILKAHTLKSNDRDLMFIKQYGYLIII